MKITVSDRQRQYVRRRIQDHMNSTVSIYRDAGSVFDEVDGSFQVTTNDPYYEGKAKVWLSNTGSALVIGEADITTTVVNISVPFNEPVPQKDDIVVIETNPNMTSLEGTAYRVTAIDGGGFIGATQRMSCVALTDSAIWSRQ